MAGQDGSRTSLRAIPRPAEDDREPAPAGGVDPDEAGAEEARLLARVRRGDEAAFEALARQQAPRLYRLALRLTGRREEAEDLVQETLVRALPRLGGFEGRARLSTYLVRALANLWKNRLRSRSRSRERASLDEPTGAIEPLDPAAGADERLLAAEQARRVRAALASLDPARRLTLVLREVEELSYEEIARLTDVPVGTVRSRLARAREELRRRVEEMR